MAKSAVTKHRATETCHCHRRRKELSEIRTAAVLSSLPVAAAFEVVEDEGVLSGGGNGPSLSSSKGGGISPITNSTSNAWNAGIASNAGRRDISRDIRDVLTRIRALSSVDPSEALATYPDETYPPPRASRSTDGSQARPPLPEVSMMSDSGSDNRLELSAGLTGEEPPELASSANRLSSKAAVVEAIFTTHPRGVTSSQSPQRGAVDAISSTTRRPHHRQTEFFDNFFPIGGPEQSFTAPYQPDTNFSVDGGALDFHSLMPPFPMQLSHSMPDRSMHNSALEDR